MSFSAVGGAGAGLRSAVARWVLPAVVGVAGLYWLRLWSPGAAEAAGGALVAVLSLSCFVIAWNAYPLSRNTLILVLGSALLWAGVLSFSHAMLAVSSGAPTRRWAASVWLASRLLVGIGALAGVSCLNLRPSPVGVIAALGGAAGLAVAGFLPAARGVTNVAALVTTVLLLCLASVFGWRRRGALEAGFVKLLGVALGLEMLGDLLVLGTLSSVRLRAEMVHTHVLHGVALWAIYAAFVEFALRRPLATLAHDASTYDAVPEAVLVVDRGGVIRQANRAAALLAGRERERCVGEDSHALFHPAQLERGACPVCDASARGVSMSARDLELAGRGRWREYSTVALYRGRQYEGAVQVIRDVTRRRERDAERRRLAAIVTSSGQAIFTVGVRGNVIESWNSGAERLFGYPAAEAIGQAVWNLVPEDFVAESRVLRERLLAGEEISGYQAERRRKDGTRVTVLLNLSPLRDSAGRVTAVANIVQDISERERAQQELANVTRALRTISACNRALVHARDTQHLMTEMCRAVVEEAGYTLVWVGTVAPGVGEPDVRPVAWAGGHESYVQTLQSKPSDHGEGGEPSMRAVLSGEVQVVDDVCEGLPAPWCQRTCAEGFRSLVVLPLRIEFSRVSAVMVIYSGEPASFGTEVVALLGGLADDLCYGIRAIRGRIVADRAARVLRQSEELLRRVIEGAAEGVLVLDTEVLVIFANRAALDLLGRAEEEVLGRGPPFPAEAESQPLLEIARPDGERRQVQVRITEIEWGGRAARMVSLQDLTERVRYERHVEFLANHDPLTGLPNRNLLNDRLHRLMAHAGRSGEQVAVMFVDLDGFKHVNDSLGHAVGDRLLRQIAERLGHAVRAEDTVARFGGDEFVVVAPGLDPSTSPVVTATKLREAFVAPFDLDGRQHHVTASIGVALYPVDGLDPSELLACADAAAYRAKDRGRDRVEFYTRAMGERARRRLSLESELRRALELDQLEAWFQPQVSLRTGAVVGAEALVRWRHPARGIVAPSEFIALTEETGLLAALGERMLGYACAEASRWERDGLGTIPVAVNLCSRQIWQQELASHIDAALKSCSLAPARLEVEVTESALRRDLVQAAGVLERVRALGVGVVIDDFGTGYSSLSYLRCLPLDKLKIDRSFIATLGDDERGSRLALEIVRLARVLELSVVAEGVETMEQARLLASGGCEAMQGYLFSAPLPAAQFRRVLAERRRLELAGEGDAGRVRR